MENKSKYFLFTAILFFILSALTASGVIFPTDRISTDYSLISELESRDNLYDIKNQEFTGDIISNSKFSYRVIEEKEDVLLIRASFNVYTYSDELVFRAEEIYGIDKKTGKHVPGYGDKDRTGYLLAPENIEDKDNFNFWFVGIDEPLNLEFQAIESINGLETYKYQANIFSDLTEGYTSLEGVPELYNVKNDIKFEIWFEPQTGRIIEFKDSANSDFYSTKTGEKLFPRNIYSNAFHDDSIALEVQKTKEIIRDQDLNKRIIPVILALFGLLFLIVSFSTLHQRITFMLIISFILLGVIAWFIVTELSKEQTLLNLSLIMLASIVLGSITSRTITTPLKRINSKIEKITKGDFDVEIEDTNVIEIKNLTSSLNRILSSLKLAVQKVGIPKEEIGIGEAIKARKEVEKEKEKIEKTLKEIMLTFDNSTIIALTDKKGTITYVNDKFTEVSKYKREELIGQNHRILKSGFHSQLFYKQLWNTISSGKIWKGDIRNKDKKGKIYWIRGVVMPRFDKKHNIIGYVAARTIITDLMQPYEKLIKEINQGKKVDVKSKKIVQELKNGTYKLYKGIGPIISNIKKDYTLPIEDKSNDKKTKTTNNKKKRIIRKNNRN